ncbi:hypothetical protein ISF_09726 [Cordyceps fumosorosea ARSEF 2679]|uniref:Uncharacterized protein n=1 Tax=Cordyceps fumosorosea (strain ARSEF 2679) TaxID=1081104 RepID=A0A167DEI7_CORFA|nr:hypothetical protein ISF_09726 [Cordyceps fumosorosea ARSEF 2679]OAA42286.1 hypothetical protein ISF_09726 [Cordyceps fumosorosea ARSEF 2679]
MGFLGIVEVPVAHLLFVEGSGQRLRNDDHRHRFADLQDTDRVHTDMRQLIAGYIDASETNAILRDAGTSPLKIKRQNKRGKYPFIENAIVRYTHGRHLIAAAVAVDSAARWAVRLYQTTNGRLPWSPGVRRCTKKYQHEQQQTDGQIYRKLRMYPDNGPDYNKWYSHLTEPKRIGMAAIDQRVDISLELNKLTYIPAVLDELYLTSIQKSFVSRLDEELLAGIRNLYSEWLRLARGNMNILKKMDKETVNALAGRAPRVCDKDRLFIDDMFSSRQVFSKVDNPEEREALRLRVQQSSGIIPSLLSLQSNLRFLGIAANIIWQYLIPKSLRLKAKQSKLSLKATLRGCWTSTVPYIEIREGEFVSATGPPNFDLVYIQLFLAAIRHFPYLSCFQPKMGRGETLQFTHDPHHAGLFVRRAKFLGVQTATIDENIKDFFPDGNYTQQLQFRNLPDESEVLSRLGNRWGRPSASIYWRIRQEGFLPTIVAHTAESRLSAIFVLRSTLRSCFNLPSFNIDFAQGICSLTARPKRARYRQLETITEEDELDMAANSRLGKRIRSDVPIPVADSRSTARSGSDTSMPDASPLLGCKKLVRRLPLWDARSSSDVSMPDASPLWDARSSSDISMPDASPLSPDRQSIMAATDPPRFGRDIQLAQPNWHRERGIYGVDDTLPTATMLEYTVPHSHCVPRRVSKRRIATIPHQ